MSNKQLKQDSVNLEGLSFSYSVINNVGFIQDGFATREDARKYKRTLEQDGEEGVKIIQHKTISTYIR